MHEVDPYRTQAVDGKGPITRRAKARARLNDWCERNRTALGFGIVAILSISFSVAMVLDVSTPKADVEYKCADVCQRVGEANGLVYERTCYCITDRGPVPFAKLGQCEGDD